MIKPKIRFKGYQEEWEQRKLGDLVDRVTRKNQDLVSELPLTISAQYGLIDQNEFFDKRVASKDVSGYYLIENGEFAYNKSTSTDAPWGAIKRLDRYENGVLSTLYIVFGIKENNPVYSDFLVSYYSTNLWHKGIHEIAAEGARNHGLLNIAPADFFETKLKIPQDIEEQKKIGKYFEELERLITLHHRKCEETKILKKYMLQKMFPQNGNSVPEIRFWGFTEDWEQRKLIDVCDYVDYRGKTPIKTDSGVFLVTAKNVKDGYIDYGASQEYISEDDYEEVMHRGKPEIGDVLITTEAPCGNVAQVNRADIALAQRIIKYRGQSNIVDNTYLKYYLLSPEFQNILNAKSSGGTVKGIKGSILHQQEIKYPKYEEQFKIGSYFNNLDHLITLHHRKSNIFIREWDFVWEQRKLGDMAEFSKGSGYSKGDLIESGTPIILYGRLYTKYETIISDVDTFVEAKDGSVYSKGGEVIVPASGETAEDIARAASVDKSGILLGGDLNVVMPNEDINSAFLAISISNGSLQRELARKAQGKSVVHIHNEEIRNLIVPFPTKAEQNKMENYFAALDHFITLHHRKQICVQMG